MLIFVQVAVQAVVSSDVEVGDAHRFGWRSWHGAFSNAPRVAAFAEGGRTIGVGCEG
jgi:hypothetical protein